MSTAMAGNLETAEHSRFSLTEAFGRVWDAIKSPFKKGDLTNNFAVAHDNSLDDPNHAGRIVSLTEQSADPKALDKGVTTFAVPERKKIQAITRYTVQSGDSLSKIAKLNGTTVDAIMELNPSIKDADIIGLGAELSLPLTRLGLDDVIGYDEKFNPKVLGIQDKLNELGFEAGVVDGFYGANTTAAVERFQEENGLYVDGFVNKDTLAKLNESFVAEQEATVGNLLARSPLGDANIIITSKFQADRVNPVTREIKDHNGTDIAAEDGQPIYATADGVIDLKYDENGYGNWAQMDHGTNVETRYAHLSKYAEGLKDGDTVRAGDIIGYAGNTGRSTGTHLHYELRVNGQPVDTGAHLKGHHHHPQGEEHDGHGQEHGHGDDSLRTIKDGIEPIASAPAP